MKSEKSASKQTSATIPGHQRHGRYTIL